MSGLTRVAPGPEVAPQITLGLGLKDPGVRGRLEGRKNFGSSLVATGVAGTPAEVEATTCAFSSLGFSTLMVTVGGDVESPDEEFFLMVKLEKMLSTLTQNVRMNVGIKAKYYLDEVEAYEDGPGIPGTGSAGAGWSMVGNL